MSNRHIPFACLLVVTFVLAAAGAGLEKEPPSPKPPAFKVPKAWRATDPSPFASARFQVGERDRVATVLVVALPRDGGGPAANVNRWRAQLGLEPLAEKEALKSLRPIRVGGVAGHAFDLTGPGKAPLRIRAVLITRGNRTWFFRMSGPASLVAEQASAFDDFIKSVRFDR